jgi:hypothetical protein
MADLTYCQIQIAAAHRAQFEPIFEARGFSEQEGGTDNLGDAVAERTALRGNPAQSSRQPNLPPRHLSVPLRLRVKFPHLNLQIHPVFPPPKNPMN